MKTNKQLSSHFARHIPICSVGVLEVASKREARQDQETPVESRYTYLISRGQKPSSPRCHTVGVALLNCKGDRIHQKRWETMKEAHGQRFTENKNPLVSVEGGRATAGSGKQGWGLFVVIRGEFIIYKMWRQLGNHVSSLPSNGLLPLLLPKHFPIYCLFQCS